MSDKLPPSDSVPDDILSSPNAQEPQAKKRRRSDAPKKRARKSSPLDVVDLFDLETLEALATMPELSMDYSNYTVDSQEAPHDLIDSDSDVDLAPVPELSPVPLKPDVPESWTLFNLNPRLLNEIHFDNPTEIQVLAIPPMVRGQNVLGSAQTGSGKTLAFVLPILHKLVSTPGTAIIVAPSRELARQIIEVATPYAAAVKISCALVIGGLFEEKQKRQLRISRLIVGTPGRLGALRESGELDLQQTCICAIDEVDKMLDTGRFKELKEILSLFPIQTQYAVFSATAKSLTAEHLSDLGGIENFAVVDVAPEGLVCEDVIEYSFPIFPNLNRKLGALLLLFDKLEAPFIVFMNSIDQTKILSGALAIFQDLGVLPFASQVLHSKKDQKRRLKAVERFTTIGGVLVATDVAARGLDLTATTVIHLDCPRDRDTYVHRTGRTGRAGRTGVSVVCYTDTEEHRLRRICRDLGKTRPENFVVNHRQLILMERAAQTALDLQTATHREIRDSRASVKQEKLVDRAELIVDHHTEAETATLLSKRERKRLRGELVQQIQDAFANRDREGVTRIVSVSSKTREIFHRQLQKQRESRETTIAQQSSKKSKKTKKRRNNSALL